MWVVWTDAWRHEPGEPLPWPEAFELMAWMTNENIPAYARKVSP
ncbi:hypothetical protein SEA_DATBOI_7 [Gordonia phage DatBoi]|nr:hypothetical protein SEA_DATBOI_7 [Gordonia phage DatBoi]